MEEEKRRRHLELHELIRKQKEEKEQAQRTEREEKTISSKYIVHGSNNGLFKYDLLTLELYLSKGVRRFDPSSTGFNQIIPPKSECHVCCFRFRRDYLIKARR